MANPGSEERGANLGGLFKVFDENRGAPAALNMEQHVHDVHDVHYLRNLA